MIDFACKKFDLEEVVKCSLGLSKSEFRLLKFLIEHDRQFTTEELAKELKLDKSTIQRSVKNLHGKNLVIRGQINQSVGGYIFLYRIKEKNKIRKMVSDTIDNWAKVFQDKIKKW
ncbi:MarR family transcriptional regulator [archaeon]|jgi:predicted transcriptional regulator|nr:MarR family transcriptional regulator [archaeon]